MWLTESPSSYIQYIGTLSDRISLSPGCNLKIKSRSIDILLLFLLFLLSVPLRDGRTTVAFRRSFAFTLRFNFSLSINRRGWRSRGWIGWTGMTRALSVPPCQRVSQVLTIVLLVGIHVNLEILLAITTANRLQVGAYLLSLVVGMLWTAHGSRAYLLRVLGDDAADLCKKRPLVHDRHVLVIWRRSLVAAVFTAATADYRDSFAVPLRTAATATAATTDASLLSLLLPGPFANTIAVFPWTLTLITSVVCQTPIDIVIVIDIAAVIVQILRVISNT